MSTLEDEPPLSESDRVANQVAPAMIGPMPRRKDGRWDFRDQGRRSLEAGAASWVIDLLQAEGHEIDDLWSPDYEPKRRPDIATRPELAMTINGEPAALDVTMFTTNARSAAAARAPRIREALEAATREAAGGRSVFGPVVYDIDALRTLPRLQVDSEALRLAAALAEGVTAIPETAENVRIATPCAWVRGASVSVSRPMRGKDRVSILIMPPRTDVNTQVDEFISERVVSKGRQLAPWGRGILVIVHGFDESPHDLADGFARWGPVPWWRVYWVGPSPEHIHLVASQG